MGRIRQHRGPIRDGSHVYADDLDLFGKGSLFELVAETRTAAAEKMLADWFLSPAISRGGSSSDCRRELCGGLDLREHFSLLGPDIQAEVSVEALAMGRISNRPFPLGSASGLCCARLRQPRPVGRVLRGSSHLPSL